METIVIISLVGLTLVCLAQTYLIFKINILYKSKDLGEYMTFTTPIPKVKKVSEPEEVEVERYP